MINLSSSSLITVFVANDSDKFLSTLLKLNLLPKKKKKKRSKEELQSIGPIYNCPFPQLYVIREFFYFKFQFQINSKRNGYIFVTSFLYYVAHDMWKEIIFYGKPCKRNPQVI